jgi:hypothetical protein
MKIDKSHILLEIFSLLISILATFLLGAGIALFLKFYEQKIDGSPNAIIGWIILIVSIICFIFLIAASRALVLFVDMEHKFGRALQVQLDILQTLKDIRDSSKEKLEDSIKEKK